MKYAVADFDSRTGSILESTIVWKNGTLEQGRDIVHKDKTKCVLFYHKDVPNMGIPVNKDATRQEFEANPAVLGVCYYKSWRGYNFE